MCDLLDCSYCVIHLCGLCCPGYLLALCVRGYLMHGDVYGYVISLFPVAALRYLLVSCLHVPLYVGLEVLLGSVAFELLGAPWGTVCVCGGVMLESFVLLRCYGVMGRVASG